jgi:hypothetical protein
MTGPGFEKSCSSVFFFGSKDDLEIPVVVIDQLRALGSRSIEHFADQVFGLRP